MKTIKTRIEKDSMGEMEVPETALYGASTQRAVLNFPISGYRFSRPFIRALGLIKWGSAEAKHVFAFLDANWSSLIVQAMDDVGEGMLSIHYTSAFFQSGTSYSTTT